ncbi:MAG: histidine kinase [Acidobacteriota bacterium]
METAPPTRVRFDRRFWALNVAAWGLLGLTNATAVAADLVRAGQPVAWPGLVAFYLAAYAPWAVITPVVFRWVERFPPAGDPWPKLLLRYAPLAVPWLLFYAPVQAAILSAARFGTPLRWTETLAVIPTNQWVVDGIYLVALIGLAAAVHHGRAERRREQEASALTLENASLETRLAEARLEMLRAQLEPHFLYNALNSISALVHQGRSELAIEAVELLSELLRYATRATDQERVALSEEVDFAEAYWGFQRLRYGDRLAVGLEVDPDVVECQLPPLILQPLLENAIRHGVEAIEGPGRVELTARRADGASGGVDIAVRNAPGRDGGGPSGLGVGLRNVRERLHWLYGRPVELRLFREEGGEDAAYVARLTLPPDAALKGTSP